MTLTLAVSRITVMITVMQGGSVTGFLFAECSLAVIIHVSSVKSARVEIVLFLWRARSLCPWSFTGPPLLVRNTRDSERRRRRRVGGGVFHRGGCARLSRHALMRRQRPLQSSNKRSERARLALCALVVHDPKSEHSPRSVPSMKTDEKRVISPERPDNPDRAKRYRRVCVGNAKNAPKRYIVISS